MSDEKWFWENEGERRGPDTAETVIAKLQAGEIGQETLVWREGMTDWKPLSATELAPSRGAPPALPPKSEATPPPPPPASSESAVLTPVAMAPEAPIRQAVLRSDFRPAIRFSFGRAWNLLKADFWPYVGFFTLMMVLTSIASQLLVPIFFLMLPLMVGFNWYVLNRLRGRAASIDDLFFGFKRGFGDLALINLVLYAPIMIIVMVVSFAAVFGIAFSMEGGSGPNEVFAIFAIGGGLLAMLILTIVFSVIYAVSNFACLLVVDCGLKWKEAMGLGWQACKGHMGKIIVFFIFASFVSSLGVIALYVGVLVTGAWSMMAMTYLYEDAFGESESGLGG
ncbi:MAG: DUF4339 domain-containing protein [Verrucomicrobiales bacterium]|nr:DUF4339 domain-containing protein [Verrucomicrobiales bacterium]